MTESRASGSEPPPIAGPAHVPQQVPSPGPGPPRVLKGGVGRGLQGPAAREGLGAPCAGPAGVSSAFSGLAAAPSGAE